MLSPPIRLTSLKLIQMIEKNGTSVIRASRTSAGDIIASSNLCRRGAGLAVTSAMRHAPTMRSMRCLALCMVSSGDICPASILESSVKITVSTSFHWGILGRRPM